MIDLGDVYPTSVTVRNAAGNLANGGVVTVTITAPDGTVAGPVTVAPTSTGVYDYDVVPAQLGRYRVRWVSTGDNSSAYEEAFYVGQAILGADVTALQRRLGVTLDGADLARAEGLIEDATALVETLPGVNRSAPITATVVLAVALRAYQNPSGLLSETIGSYSYTRAPGGSAGVYLTPEERALLVPRLGHRVRSVPLVAVNSVDPLPL